MNEFKGLEGRVVHGMPFEQYLAVPAYGSTTVRQAALQCAAEVVDPDNNREKAGQRLGTAAHAAIGEPARFAVEYARKPTPDDLPGALVTMDDIRGYIDRYQLPVKKSGKKDDVVAALLDHQPAAPIWDVFLNRWMHANANRTVLHGAEYDKAVAMAEAAWRYGPTKAMLEDEHTLTEVSFFWRDPETGLPCKGRFDLFNPVLRLPGMEKRGIAADWKTCPSASQRAFRSHAIYKQGYHIQGAFYLDGFDTIDPHVNGFVLVALEVASNSDVFRCKLQNGEPKGIAAYALTPAQYEWGQILYREGLNRIAEAEATGVWAGYPQKIIPLTNLDEGY